MATTKPMDAEKYYFLGGQAAVSSIVCEPHGGSVLALLRQSSASMPICNSAQSTLVRVAIHSYLIRFNFWWGDVCTNHPLPPYRSLHLVWFGLQFVFPFQVAQHSTVVQVERLKSPRR